MAGIYIHIPFCKQACSYCDFHFSTNSSNQSRLIECLAKEIEDQAEFFENERIETVYIGGGTPSLLSGEQLGLIMDTLRRQFSLHQVKESTLECNPDDISAHKALELADLGINRISLGIQSFNDNDLRLMKRAHTAKMGWQAIENLQAAGFSNITIDLIYGIPNRNEKDLEENLLWIPKLGIPHFSAYALTVEPKTLLAHQVKKKLVEMPRDDNYRSQFMTLLRFAKLHSYDHYELSNFALPGHYSVHNSNYWRGRSYLGLGPSAHSYKSEGIRYHNVSNNVLYIKGVDAGQSIRTEERLSNQEKLNELLMTRLRTSEGLNLEKMPYFVQARIRKEVLRLDPNGEFFNLEKDRISLHPEGLLISDYLISELMEVD